MKPEDQAAFEFTFLKSFIYPEKADQLTFKLGFQSGCEHRDAQASAINEQMLDLLKSFGHKLGCEKNAFRDRCTCGVDAAITAAEALEQSKRGVV